MNRSTDLALTLSSRLKVPRRFGLEHRLRRKDASIHLRLSREVDYRVRFGFGEARSGRRYQPSETDSADCRLTQPGSPDFRRRWFIDVDDLYRGILEGEADKARSDESGASGYKDFHLHFHCTGKAALVHWPNVNLASSQI